MAHDPINTQKSRDFLALPREAFERRYAADAAQIHAAQDRLNQVIQEAVPIRPAVENLLHQEVRRSIAATLSRGGLPKVTPATVAQVRFQTAYASLEHLTGLRALGREPELTLSSTHRQLLVEAASTNSAGGKALTLPLPPLRAQEIAGQLAGVDPAGERNPFADGPLKKAYDQHRADRAASNVRSIERGRD